MFRLGLTGSIATGKSTVLSMFAAKGHPTFSADSAVHLLYQDQGKAIYPISKVFPEVVIAGQIDRDRLARMLVKSPEKISELEAIVHPLVRAEIEEFIKTSSVSGAKLAVVDIPLLFETGTRQRAPYDFDAVAVTFCTDEEQRKRAMARPGMSVEKLKTILARQLNQTQKRQRADFEIDTNLSLEETRQKVDKIINICLSNNCHSSNGASR